MAIAAFRYCCGRYSDIVGDCVDWLIEMWPYLASNTRDVIRRDLEADFQRDDEARAGDMFRPLGADCDREQWERVRALWAIAEESSND